MGSIPGGGNKILHGVAKKKKDQISFQKPSPELNDGICDPDIICFQLHISHDYVAHK